MNLLFFQINLSYLFHLVHFVKCWQIFLELNSNGLSRTCEVVVLPILSYWFFLDLVAVAVIVT